MKFLRTGTQHLAGGCSETPSYVRVCVAGRCISMGASRIPGWHRSRRPHYARQASDSEVQSITAYENNILSCRRRILRTCSNPSGDVVKGCLIDYRHAIREQATVTRQAVAPSPDHRGHLTITWLFMVRHVIRASSVAHSLEPTPFPDACRNLRANHSQTLKRL